MGFSVSQLYFNKDIYKNVGWIVRSTDDGTRMECVHPDVIWSSFFFFFTPRPRPILCPTRRCSVDFCRV